MAPSSSPVRQRRTLWLLAVSSPVRQRRTLWLLAVAVGYQLGMGCGPFKGVGFSAPLADEIFTQDSFAVFVRVGTDNEESSIALTVAGVDLAAELALVPPFMDESGVVDIGGTLVDVTGFSIFSVQGLRRIDVTLTGLPPAEYTLEASAVNIMSQMLVTAERTVTVVDFLAEAASDTPSMGAPGGLQPLAGGGVLANASLGQAIAAPAVPTLGGQSIRSGHVEVAEELIQGAP